MFPFAAPILESKSVGAIFQKKGKMFENLHKKVAGDCSDNYMQ